MKEKLIRFMQGRYGIDQLSKFLLITGLAVVLLSAFFGETAVSMLLYIFGWGVVIYCYFRIFSRNVQKRYAENQAYLMKTYKIRNWFQNQKNIWQILDKNGITEGGFGWSCGWDACIDQ